MKMNNVVMSDGSCAMTELSDLETIVNTHDLSQQSVDAFVSMIMVQLPFPPMPLIANRSGDEIHCSSHDLLSRVLALRQVVGNDYISVKGMTPEKIQEEKILILTNLMREIKCTCASAYNVGTCTYDLNDTMIEKCYDSFQKYFRMFLQLYPTFTSDIRFLPMCDVDKRSLICSQALQHLHAKLVLTTQIDAQAKNTDDTIVAYKLQLQEESYSGIIRAYICDLLSFA